jgi:SNF2 family DNA or RNA helicase
MTSEELNITIYPTGWQTALTRPPKLRVNSWAPSSERVEVTTLRPKEKRAPKIFSIAFGTSSWLELKSPEGEGNAATQEAAAKHAAQSRPKTAVNSGATAQAEATPATVTRIRPPKDAIRLEDRLYYLLQPPLETLLSTGSLTFPFKPFPYQFAGIAFLYARHSAVLADEMGLGKTMQAITTIRMLLHAGEVRNVLMICPKPLVSNWRREFGMWAPEIPLTVIEGDSARRQWQWRLPDAPVKIANYELLMRDQETILADDMQFDLVVLDEAQRIKNRSSTTSQIVRNIKRSRNWALTGTPVENSTEDLVGIFEFLSPGYLHTGMTARAMSKSVGDHILRRTKDRVLTDLPPKMYRDAEIALSPAQQYSYERAESEGVIQLADLGSELTVQHVFELVLRLKQICNFDPATGDSSKLERLLADLEEVAASGKKAIIFSQWVDTLEKLRGPLKHLKPLEYHGQIPQKQRESVIQNFKEDKRSHVIMMSYGAGSVGLNLQFCEYVFLFDRWWNPAIEDQAINRAHRIGAAGPVTVTRFLALGTIEERINQVLDEKRELFDTILSNADKPKKLGLSQREIFGLFKLHTPDGPINAAA